jgi:hypothetical protein
LIVEIGLLVLVALAMCFMAWELHRSRAAEARANGRLYAAWRDNYNIPIEPPMPMPEGTVELLNTKPLIRELQDLVDDWDDARGKENQLAIIRYKINQGKTQQEVLREILGIEGEADVLGEPELAVQAA